MQIARTRLQKPVLSTLSNKQGDPTAIPPEAIDLSELPEDAKRVRPIESTFESMEVAPTKLKRPLLMVHGLAQHADTWATFKTHLCSDPENVWGGVFHVDKEEEFQASLADKTEAKVFALDISDNLAAPRVVANEVRRAITAIMKGTGAESVDVMTHSMGSLVTREALRQGEDSVANLLMIAPPNRGAYEATAATFLGDSGVYEHYPQAKLGAMDALRLEYGPRGGVRNEWLHSLNEHWKNDSDRPRASVITGIGIPTPDRSATVTSPGDGMVAARHAPLEGADFHLAVPNNLPAGDPNFRDFQQFRYNHLQIVSEPEIWKTSADFLADGADKPAAGETFSEALDEAERRNTSLMEKVSGADVDRAELQTKQNRATMLATAGAVTALTGLAASASSVPYLSSALTAAGVIGFGAASMSAFRHASKLGANSKLAVDSAEKSLNLTDGLLHKNQRTGSVEVAGSSSVMDRTRGHRSSLVEADYARRYNQNWQRRGMKTAGVGAAVAGVGLAMRSFFPTLGTTATVAGALAIGGGALVGLLNSNKLGKPAAEASAMAHQATELTSKVIEEFRGAQEEQNRG